MHVRDAPFSFNVDTHPAPRLTNRGFCGTQHRSDLPGTNPLDMEATLTGPSGKSELCEIRDMPQSLYDIKFVPWEEGVHTVSLKYKGLHISGTCCLSA